MKKYLPSISEFITLLGLILLGVGVGLQFSWTLALIVIGAILLILGTVIIIIELKVSDK